MLRVNPRRSLPVLLALGAAALLGFQREEEENGLDRPLERWHYFYDQRQSSAGEFPEGGRLRAYRALDRMERALKARETNARAAVFNGTWKAIGPQPISFNPNYVTSGRVTAMAIDPRNNDTVYL